MTEESQHTQSFIFVFAVLALSIGILALTFSDSGITGFVVYDNGSSCDESWVEQYTECGIDDTKIKYYIDEANCDQGEGMPVDNGTAEACDFCVPSPVRINGTCNTLNTMPIFSVDELGCFNMTGLASDAVNTNISSSTCDYCVPTWSLTESACSINNTKTVTYAYTNTCCSDTGLGSDCTLPNPLYNSTCDHCTPSWNREKTDCVNNNYVIYYVDDHDCFSLTNLTSDIEGKKENETVTCTSCVPEWISIDSACNNNQYVTFYFDTNNCGKSENAPANVTHTCDSEPALEAIINETSIFIEPELGPEEVLEDIALEKTAELNLEEGSADSEVLLAAGENDGSNNKKSTSIFTGRIIDSLSDKSGFLTYIIAFILLVVGFLSYLITIKYGNHIRTIVPSGNKIDKSAKKYFDDIGKKFETPSVNYLNKAKQEIEQQNKESKESTSEQTIGFGKFSNSENVKSSAQPAKQKIVFGKKNVLLSKKVKSVMKTNKKPSNLKDSITIKTIKKVKCAKK